MSDKQLKEHASHIENVASNEGQQGIFHGPVVNNIYNLAKPEIDLRYRKALVAMVRQTWNDFLEGITFIPLGLYEQPDLIMSPSHRAEGHLPVGTSIVDVYDKCDGKLLILGKPGSGKTALLFQLIQELLARAEKDESLSMPVVFNLSRWANKRQKLAKWLIEELHHIYKMPTKMAAEWVEKYYILPLLDGLDEVAEEYRDACINEINTYMEHFQAHLIISSRIDEYKALLPKKLAVQRAVIAQPLSVQQIDAHLEDAGGNFKELQKLLRDDADLQEFAKNPFMLSVLKRIYEGGTEQLKRIAHRKVQRQQIFIEYVRSMLERRDSEVHYSPKQAQTERWLTWLAQQMRKRSQTVFYQEDLQVDCLEKSWPAEISTSIAIGLLTYPVTFIIFGLDYIAGGVGFAVVNGMLVALAVTIIAFLFTWRIETNFLLTKLLARGKGKGSAERKTVPEESQKGWFDFLAPSFVERASFAILCGFLLVLFARPLVGFYNALGNGVILAAFLIALGLGRFNRVIRPVEKLFWTWESLKKNVVPSLLIGLVAGALMGVFFGYPYFHQWHVFGVTFIFYLSLGAAVGVVIMLMRGFSSGKLDKKQRDIKPNQGMRNSFSNSLRLGLSSGLLLGLVILVFYGYIIRHVFIVGFIDSIPEHAGVIYGVSDAVAIAYLFWLLSGGFATVQHLMLRMNLWKTGCIPWRYSRFLEYAYKHFLLRRAGSGYMFMHELLLDYFVGLDSRKNPHQLTAEHRQPELLSFLEVTNEVQVEPTERLRRVTVVSTLPLLLPCGHERPGPEARYCSICGKPVSTKIERSRQQPGQVPTHTGLLSSRRYGKRGILISAIIGIILVAFIGKMLIGSLLPVPAVTLTAPTPTAAFPISTLVPRPTATLPVSTPVPTPTATFPASTLVPTPTINVANMTPSQLYTAVTSRNATWVSSLSHPDSANWDDSNLCTFSKGVYVDNEPNSGFNPCYENAFTYANFAFQVQMTIVSGEANDGGGIIFRHSQSGDYRLRIGTDGSYDIAGANIGGSSVDDTIFHKGLNQTNLLTVIAQGSTMVIYVNKQILQTIRSSTSESGTIGVMSVFFNQAVTIDFSNAQIWTF